MDQSPRLLVISAHPEKDVVRPGASAVFIWVGILLGSDSLVSTDLVRALQRARHVDEIASVALRFLRDLPGVVRAGLALSVVGGRQLRFLSSDGAALSPPLQWCSIDAYDRLPLNDAIRTGRDIVLNATEFAGEYPALFARQGDGTPPSVVALALRAGERRLGGLLLYRAALGLADPLAGLGALGSFAAEVAGALLAAQSVPNAPVELVCEQLSAGAAEPLGTAYLRLPADETGPGLARRFLNETLQGWGVEDTVVEAALLCASEVVTNVVLHVRESSVIRVHRHHDRLIVHVHQPSVADVPEIKPADLDDPLAVAGRGLLLVDAVSSRWGATSTGSVSCVWYELGLEETG